jgi:putative tryptophan/tyrosine transport system substrate-binding protein
MAVGIGIRQFISALGSTVVAWPLVAHMIPAGAHRMAIGRRQFISTLGGVAATWPLAARAQPAIPVIGILSTASPEAYATRLRAFREALGATGYVEGQNVNIDYRWAEADSGRLPELAAQLVAHQVAILVAAGGSASALAAKAVTTSTPIVFGVGTDPVSLGLVASLNRPGGNVTGVTSLNVEVAPKRLELLHELLPSATNMALLVNPAVPATAEAAARLSQTAAHAAGLQLHVLNANSERDFDTVYNSIRDQLTRGLHHPSSRSSGLLAGSYVHHPAAPLSPIPLHQATHVL